MSAATAVQVKISATTIKAIEHEHAECQKSLTAGIRHAIACGDMLLSVKKQLAHGEFGEWVKNNVTFTPRMATNYMKLAKNKDEFKATDATSLRKALARVSRLDKKKGRKKAGQRFRVKVAHDTFVKLVKDSGIEVSQDDLISFLEKLGVKVVVPVAAA